MEEGYSAVFEMYWPVGVCRTFAVVRQDDYTAYRPEHNVKTWRIAMVVGEELESMAEDTEIGILPEEPVDEGEAQQARMGEQELPAMAACSIDS